MNDKEREEYIKEHDIKLIKDKHGQYLLTHGRLGILGKPKPSHKLSKYVRVGTRRG